MTPCVTLATTILIISSSLWSGNVEGRLPGMLCSSTADVLTFLFGFFKKKCPDVVFLLSSDICGVTEQTLVRHRTEEKTHTHTHVSDENVTRYLDFLPFLFVQVVCLLLAGRK